MFQGVTEFTPAITCSPPTDIMPTMDAIQFKNIHTRVRPSRIAVLVREDDSAWQDVCRVIIGVVQRIWGGKYSLIIPTDGNSIRDPFWKLLEAYDPDFICSASWSLWEVKELLPHRYNEWFLRWVQHEQSALEGEGKKAPELEESFQEVAKNSYFTSVELSSDLESELKRRLSPFFLESNVIQGLVNSKPESSYPFTNVQTILPNCDHPDTVLCPEVTAEGLPPLWVESIAGSCANTARKELAAKGVTANTFAMDDGNASGHFAKLLGSGGDPIGELRHNPFNLTMLRLAQYRQPGVVDNGELTVVCGLTVSDFALYFSLRAITGRVYWLLPEWIERLENARRRAARGEEAVRPNEEYASSFAQRLVNESMERPAKSIRFVSLSLEGAALSNIASKLIDCAFSFGYRLTGLIKISTNVTELIAHPLRVLNIDAFSTVTVQLIGDQLAGFFPTPRPKGFTEIVPYHHRWVTELYVNEHRYPRHPALGTFLISDAWATTEDIRSGSDGICYLCPSSAYFGGDVDTILRRPAIRIPTAAQVFEYLASSADLKSKLSDKGFYAQEFVRKLGGLENAAGFLRNPLKAALLKEYRKEGDATAQGCFLNSDRRRYLDLKGISAVVDSGDLNELLDDLVGKGILHRGLILKCRYCRIADWFSMADVSEAFRCNRCRAQQAVLSINLFERSEPTWYYKLDELLYQGLVNNMHVPLLALDRVRRSSKSFMYVEEQELFRVKENKPFIELDICCISDGILTIGEAKISNQIADTANAERLALNKYRDLASRLGIGRFVLATETDWSSRTLEIAEEAFRNTNINLVTLRGTDLAW